MAPAEEFAEFAEAMSPRLRRTAFLLCGDWLTAEDLAQTALAKVFVSWRRIQRQDAGHAYTNRTLVNAYLAHRRLKRTGELLTGWFPERAAPDPAPETRMLLLDALAALPPRSRAAVVLRHWADLSVEQVADVMGCSPGNVKSLRARALAKLRAALSEAMADATNALRAGLKRRRRRVLGVAGSMAVAAGIAVVIFAVTGPPGAPPASGQHPAATFRINGSANVSPPPRASSAGGRWPRTGQASSRSAARRRRPATGAWKARAS